jgi:glycine/D-amino acid oxidase-like deaminating enzyme
MTVARTDVLVVGAGIIGCLTAREIAHRSPGLRLTMVDRGLAGGGASMRSAGLHLPRGGTERVRRMADYSQTYYRELRRCLPGAPIRSLRMSVLTAGSNADRLHRTYLKSAHLSRVDRVTGGLRIPQDTTVWSGEGSQHADVQALTELLVRGLRPRVDVREGVGVIGLEPVGDEVSVRLSSGENLTAGRVVLAAGPWLATGPWPRLLPPGPFRVKKVVALHIEQVPLPNDHVIVFEDEDAFLLPLADRRHWLFSYTCTTWDVDPDTVSQALAPEDLAAARETLRRYAPGLAERCMSGRVFCDAYSGTGEPHVECSQQSPRIVLAGAANGSGYRLAPAIALRAADLLEIARSTA